MFTLRFDLRSRDGAVGNPDLYGATVEMCAWAEARGAVVAVLSEHHGTDDGHLAAPQILAAAIAARTSRLMIMLAAVPLPFWDPVRLAEEVCALDILSRGRVSFVFGLGHRSDEYEHFGCDPQRLARFPVPGEPTAVFVADDVDRAWQELGPYLLHDALTAASYRHGDDSVASISRATTVAALRAEPGPYRVLCADEATEYVKAGSPLPLHPLCGGLPPETAWPYLERAVEAAGRSRSD
jgi:hypothetical protein